MLDNFTDTTRIIKSYVLAHNILTWLVVPIDKSKQMVIIGTSETHKKCGRLFGLEDIIPRNKNVEMRRCGTIAFEKCCFSQILYKTKSL